MLYGTGDLGEVYAISLAQTIGAYSLVTDDTKQGGPYMSLMQLDYDVKPFTFADILILRYLLGLTDKALALLEGLKEAVNGITSEFSSYISNLQKGKSDFSRIMKHKDFGVLLKKVCDDDSPKAVLDILRWLESSQLKKYRAEYIYRIEKLYTYISEEGVSIKDAVEKLGNSERFIEKDFAFARLSSRTVLTKGLEFECVIIDIRDKMDVRDFYVAMTRATKYIYVISDNTQLSFKGVLY